MKVYATKERFDGQRATVGRIIVVNLGTSLGIQAGLIQAISADDQVAIAIWDPGHRSGMSVNTANFVPTKTEEDVNRMPIGSWTWPIVLTS